MLIARVVGNVVATQKNAKLEGAKLLLVQPVDLAGVSPLRWNGFIPTAGPMWLAYNYIPGISPPPYPALRITVTP